MSSFRWNGRLVTPGVPEDHGATLPVIAFIIFMVFNIAATVKVRTRVYEFPPQRFYNAAVHFSKDAFSQISLPTIQAMVMLINHSMLMPAEINLWTLVHLASAHCVELGIHREHHSERPEDFAMKQIRRFTFFTVYSLDRYVTLSMCCSRLTCADSSGLYLPSRVVLSDSGMKHLIFNYPSPHHRRMMP